MKGAFHCPKCKTANACSCKNCAPSIKEGEPVITWEENGEIMICAVCGNRFTLDQAANTELKLQTINSNQ